MIGAIPNPTKSLTIQFPLDQVKIAARNINKVMSFCHFREENDIFNSYKFSRTEFLSFGALINIHLKKVDELTTQIDIEISRQMGAFDDWVEVSKANRHLDETMNAISEILTNGVPSEILTNGVPSEILTNGVPKKQEEPNKETGNISDKKVSMVEGLATIIGAVTLLGGFLWVISLVF